MVSVDNLQQQLVDKEYKNTIVIDTLNQSTFNLNMTELEKNELVIQGKIAVLQHFKKI